jgi:2-methylisocitrate lyase-like PEP mutase family enzyme
MSQREKAIRFRELHAAAGSFVFPNPWDAGTAKALAGLGFAALATSSGACAATLGKRDGEASREETLEHARAIVKATDLPVAADLENGFGDDPATCVETISMAAAVGLVGGSIEDASRADGRPLYSFDDAVARVAAAVEAARRLDFPFTLTARAEGFLRGQPDLDEVIRRLQAFERVGADVLMAPGLPTLEAVRKVCSTLSKPFNFMEGIPGKSFTVSELTEAGVKRISLAGSLHRAAWNGFLAAAREVKEHGTVDYINIPR